MIETRHLSKMFGDFKALEDVSCTIGGGCIYGMVGANGAGKSTFLRVLAGVYRPDGGEALMDGNRIFDNPAAKGRIAYVPDELYFLSGANMERMASMYEALFPRFDRKRFRELAGTFRLNTRQSLGTFSKGMRRQAATILASCTHADYIFFDETFDGLDPVMRNLVKSLIGEDMKEGGCAAIITSHSLRELEDTCDQLALLHRGGLVLQSDVETLRTAKFKIQIAFTDAYSRDRFTGIDIVHFVKHGSVSNMIVRGDREEVVSRLRAMNPPILDVLPLTLEEIFTYEMEALGYSFSLNEDAAPRQTGGSDETQNL